MPNLELLMKQPWFDYVELHFQWGREKKLLPGYKIFHTVEGVPKHKVEQALIECGWNFQKVRGGWMCCHVYSYDSLGLENE